MLIATSKRSEAKLLNGKNKHVRNFDLAPALENAPPTLTHNLKYEYDDTDEQQSKRLHMPSIDLDSGPSTT